MKIRKLGSFCRLKGGSVAWTPHGKILKIMIFSFYWKTYIPGKYRLRLGDVKHKKGEEISPLHKDTTLYLFIFLSGHRYKNFLTQKELQIKMSFELFHKVPTWAIETLFDEQNQPLFKRADLGKYLGIENIKHNFKEFPSHYTRSRLD